MLILPDDLRDAITRALAAVPAARWMREAQALSERYRAARDSYGHSLATGDRQALGYAAMILPATYAQLRGAMAATALRVPQWAPATLLDLGSGPGTALWAATAQWPSLHSLTAWELEPAFIALGRDLARESRSVAVRGTRWERVDLRTLQPTTDERRTTNDERRTTNDERRTTNSKLKTQNSELTYDLVVLGHVLNELDPDARGELIAAAWRLTAGLLLIVEPGTPEAFAHVRASRDQLLSAGARTIAPCAHDRPCPLERDWCHFPQRLKRPDFQRRARGAPSEWEDSKFSYAALARFPPEAPIWGRIIREPVSNKAYAEVQVSSIEGIAHYRVQKRHRDAFREIKRLEWGAALPQPLPPIEKL
jgi:ribosomal protein RSM22 (predicted rRNA methylase)